VSLEAQRLKCIIEGALMALAEPLSMERMLTLFMEHEQPSRAALREALDTLQAECAGRGVELVEVASGYRYQVRGEFGPWVGRLWEERPARYSRALLETLALVAYRQPITRAEIEEIRGVAVNSNIVKTLMERGWIREIGHREVPGRPALLATTRAFLDYFNLASLDALPPLAELRDLDAIARDLARAEGEVVDDEEVGDATPTVDEGALDATHAQGEAPLDTDGDVAHDVARDAPPEAASAAAEPTAAPTPDATLASTENEPSTGQAPEPGWPTPDESEPRDPSDEERP